MDMYLNMCIWVSLFVIFDLKVLSFCFLFPFLNLTPCKALILWGNQRSRHPNSWKSTSKYKRSNFQFPCSLKFFRKKLQLRRSPRKYCALKRLLIESACSFKSEAKMSEGKQTMRRKGRQTTKDKKRGFKDILHIIFTTLQDEHGEKEKRRLM